eukprot:3717867-Pleurochrysis_carterae.AAC.6
MLPVVPGWPDTTAHLCQSGSVCNDFQRHANLISSAVTCILARIRLYTTVLVLAVVSGRPATSPKQMVVDARISISIGQPTSSMYLQCISIFTIPSTGYMLAVASVTAE